MKGKIKALVQYISIWCVRLGLDLFNLFPIRNNRVVFYSYNGKQYTCSPKCVSDALVRKGGFEIWWAFKSPERFASLLPEGVRAVKYRSLKYYFLAKTARAVVFNVQGYGELARRRGQAFIQTWHASNGYKKVGNFTGLARKVNLLGHRDYSYVMSGARSMTERRVRGSMGFKGEVLPGTPRMDELVNLGGSGDARVKADLGISEGSKLLLYAPTWRTNRANSADHMDCERLRDVLERRFGGEWTIAVRLHPNVRERIAPGLPHVVDATDYPDMQALLCAADALISDYSSCIWDYSFTGRPCLLYCYDLEEYYSEKSFDIPIERWRFPIATTMDALVKAIEGFDEEAFKAQMDRHHREMGSLEDGKATQRACDIIERAVKGQV